MTLLSDPDAVHLNLLRGTLARPSLEQIIHLYGAEALRVALPAPPDPDTRVAELERVIAAAGAANYAETAVTHEELGPLTLTLQRRTGATPHELRLAAETRADQAERRERALLASNQRERSALTEIASLRSRLRDAGRRAEADPDRALDLLRSAVRDAGAL